MTNIHMINELNNNSIFPAKGSKNQLPDSVIDAKRDIGRVPGLYKADDSFRPYTIYGNRGEFASSFSSSNFGSWFSLLDFGNFSNF